MAPSQQNHIRALTGIRFVAALCVFVHHMLGRLGVTTFNCALGDGGVTFFFVLSGFILSYVYADRLTSYRDLPRFYFTRWARIWPLHIVTLIIFVFCVFKLRYITNNPTSSQKLALNVLLIQSWVPSYAWAFAYNGVSWSISTEVFFYLMFPLLVLKRGWFWIKYLVATLAIAFYLFAVYALTDSINQTGWASVSPLVHSFPVVRLFEFMTGMAAGYLFLARPSLHTSDRNFWKDSLIELAVIGLLLAYYYWQFYSPQTVDLPAMFNVLKAKSGPVLFYAILIFFLSHTRGIFGQLMGSRVMVYLGEISFAFYMVHFIVIHLLSKHDFAPLPLFYGGLLLAALVLSIAAASLLYHIVEMPAKASLLAWYDRGFVAFVRKTLSSLKAALLSLAVWRAVAAIGVMILFLQSWTIDEVKNKQAINIIKNTQLFQHPIHFESEAVLFGLVSNETDDAIEFELAWVKKRDQGRQRLLEIYSPDDKLLHSIHRVHQRFLKAPVGEVFVEKFEVSKQKLTGTARLCMAFFSKEEKMGRVSGGPRSFFKRRLDLYTAESAEN